MRKKSTPLPRPAQNYVVLTIFSHQIELVYPLLWVNYPHIYRDAKKLCISLSVFGLFCVATGVVAFKVVENSAFSAIFIPEVW